MNALALIQRWSWFILALVVMALQSGCKWDDVPIAVQWALWLVSAAFLVSVIVAIAVAVFGKYSPWDQ